MQNYDKLLQANLPDALQSAIENLDGAFDIPKQLLQADVSSLEPLNCCVFAYFARDDVFYLNQKGRELLRQKQPSFERKAQSAPPIFWLEDDPNLQAADNYVASRQRPLFETRELITLSWGKTWLHGSKFPIRSILGHPLAIIFAGHEVPPSQQIKLVAEHYQTTQQGTGDN
ncbi:hypothetical protein [Pelagicoccus sp. SDUM812002]|uniref:hypothetical protein n=1 Tax=Pelagicoccus sp. SDUM812002 TaxID=3041266 RepID=UPI00280D65BE|nr:hypothetical protein [Pelagicoccus sp. SDUM812002]MDQ8186447.1 hypothetical protein [Pelagicoccus sp. SDUM812002]